MSRFIGELNIAFFPMMALGLFLLAFTIIALQVFFPSRSKIAEIRHMATAPLADDQPSATGKAADLTSTHS
jgi:hypothetical protein